ncbi:MAG TPA: hypothetical protein VEA69_05740 [Tepidisphaeraceae bacterium]|nr:hypothetical protein [Tepidisphaeraceae bacterium]
MPDVSPLDYQTPTGPIVRVLTVAQRRRRRIAVLRAWAILLTLLVPFPVGLSPA